MRNLFLLAFLFSFNVAFCQGISINLSNTLPDTSAILDISSDSMGVLIPRNNLLSIFDTISIKSPATSLLIFNNGDSLLEKGLFFWSVDGWQKFSDNKGFWNLKGNSETDTATHYMGHSSNNDIIVLTNNTERIRFKASGVIGLGTKYPSKQLTLSKSLSIPNTINSDTGCVNIGSVRFINNFNQSSDTIKNNHCCPIKI